MLKGDNATVISECSLKPLKIAKTDIRSVRDKKE